MIRTTVKPLNSDPLGGGSLITFLEKRDFFLNFEKMAKFSEKWRNLLNILKNLTFISTFFVIFWQIS